MPYFDSREEFESMVADFFARPDELVFGMETAVQAQRRFTKAVDNVLTNHPTGNIAIVAHGTVLTLFLAHYNHFPPFLFWQKLQLPDFFVVALPGMTL